MSHSSLRVWQVRLYRLVGLLTILSLVIPASPVSASSPKVLPPISSGQLQQRSQIRHNLLSSQASLVETSTPTAPVESAPLVTEATVTPEPVIVNLPEGLVFTFQAAPEQVQPGDSVTFSVTLSNQSEVAFTQPIFSNVVPTGFDLDPTSLTDLIFDSNSRVLMWSATEIAPQQTVTLAYTLTVKADIDLSQPQYLVDTAVVTAAELAEPLKAETQVLVFGTASALESVTSSGGIVTGLDGQVEVEIPSGVIDGAQAVVVEDITSNYPATDDQPWTAFELTLLGSDTVAQSSESETVVGVADESLVVTELPAATESPTEPVSTESPIASETPISTETPIAPDATATPEESATPTSPDATATPLPQEATPTEEPSLATPEAEALAAETDTTVPLTQVEALFEQPVTMTISFDGLADLANLKAGDEAFVVTLDEVSGVWVKVPIESVDLQTNSVTVETTHFSTWGAGVGPTFPTNGANVLLFDSAQPDLTIGRSKFSIPIWTPPGRNGLAPSLALSYSSSTMDGVLGDIQAPWAGAGWNIDFIEVARKITDGGCGPCGNGAYGYKNEYILLFNGSGGEMIADPAIPGRYHTKNENFLYIQLHNNNIAPASTNNTTGEWWEIVTKDGTHWRLGDTTESEQLAAMAGYPGNNTGAWATLGYAGHANNVVVARWRVSQVTDVYGNTMTFSYTETSRQVAGVTDNYDRASYAKEISYNGGDYLVRFVTENRNGTDQHTESQHDWDNWDTDRLDKIEIRYGVDPEERPVVRTYDLGYTVRSYTEHSRSWQTTTLTSVVVSGTVTGTATTAPTTTFTYTDKDDRAYCGTTCQVWAYPRLATIANGWGGVATYTYSNDGRTATDSWYNWRVDKLEISDGVSGNVIRTDFAYSTPCYNDDGAGWCNAQNKGGLVGYAQTTVTQKDFNGTTVLGASVHKFYTDEPRAGREYETQAQDASGTILSKTLTTYTVLKGGLPDKGFFTFASAVDQYIRQGSDLTLISHNEYDYDTANGTLNTAREYDPTVTIPQPFSDGFESQNLNLWQVTDPNGSTVSVGSGAKLIDGYGLQVTAGDGLFPEKNGAVIIEAEANTGTVAGSGSASGHSWQTDTSNSGYSGTGTKKANPNNDITVTGTNGPALTYKIWFQNTGTYYVYLRAFPPYPHDHNDTVHVALDGAFVTYGTDGLEGFSGNGLNYEWRSKTNHNSPVTTQINIPTPGLYKLGLYMREDGFIIDKIWLSKTAGVVSEGSTSTGPTASPVMNTQARFVQKTLDSSAAAYHARFWFDPNSLTIPNGSQTIFEGTGNGTSRFKLDLQKSGSNYQLSVQTLGAPSDWQTITDGPHLLDIEYLTDATNGYVKLSVDGLPAVSKGPVNTAGLTVGEIKLGLLGNINSATRGALYFDDFKAWTTLVAPYRYSRTEYSRYTDPTDKWMIEKVSRQTTWDSTNTTTPLSDQRYRYDGSNGAVGALGELRYTRTVNPQVLSQFIDTGYFHDGWGNVIATCAYLTPGPNIDADPSPACTNSSNATYYRLSTVTYDDTYNLFPESTTNPAGHTTTLTPDPATGLTLTVKDPNGQIDGTVTTTTYDGLGRALTITNPGYAQPNIKYFYPTLVGGTVTAPFAVQLQAWDETASVYRSAWTIYDGLGRGLQVQGPAEASGQRILVDTKYDARSLTLYSGLPRQLADTDSSRVALTNLLNGSTAYYYTPTWANVLHSTNDYDALARLTKATLADTTQQRVFYDGLTTTLVDANNHQKVQVNDVFGHLQTVKEYTGTYPSNTLYATTTYTYNALNLLTTITDAVTPTANITTIQYDGFGRKKSMTDPDMGYWQYGYDLYGNLISQIDAKSQRLSFEYDSLNRMTKKWSGEVGVGTVLATYTYDDITGGNKGLGQRTNLIDSSGTTTTWFYSRNAQAQPVVTATTSISGAPQSPYTSTATSDAWGRVLSQIYPSGEVLTYGYNAMGALETLSGTNTYITGVNYNENGQVTASYLGNGIISQACYQANNLRLTQFRAYGGSLQSCGTSPSSPRLNLQYSQYDNIGNVKQITDVVRSETLNYTYDDLDRLLNVGGAYSQSFAYSGNDGKIGNLTSKSGVTQTYTAQSASCPSGALSKPHVVTSTSSGSDSYCYDANGNMERRTEGGVTYTQNFDVENRLTSITPTSGTAVSFRYDGDGNLVAKLEGAITTYYISGVYEVETSTTGGTTTTTKKTSYYPAGGAMRVEDVGASTNYVFYILKDHLGSASVTLDSNGIAVAEMRFYPFGETRVTSGAMPTDQQFTGQRSLGANLGGIYYYGARMYSPKLGRFLSADTVVPDETNPQAYNRYSYVYNKPTKFVDPSGHYADCSTFAPGYDDAYASPDGGVFSQADCWAYNANINAKIQVDVAGILLYSMSLSASEAEMLYQDLGKIDSFFASVAAAIGVTDMLLAIALAMKQKIISPQFLELLLIRYSSLTPAAAAEAVGAVVTGVASAPALIVTSVLLAVSAFVLKDINDLQGTIDSSGARQNGGILSVSYVAVYQFSMDTTVGHETYYSITWITPMLLLDWGAYRFPGKWK